MKYFNDNVTEEDIDRKPNIVRLCSSSGRHLEFIRIDILQEIKAEIVEERKGYPPSADEYKTINKVLQIIDKHRAESEEV